MTADLQLKSIENLKGAALRAKFREVTGAATRSNNRPYLLKRIAEVLVAQAATTIPVEAAAGPTTEPKSSRRKPRKRDPRLPAAGAILEREHGGEKHRVKVLGEGFEFRGETYRSLSAIAKEITGTIWNGLLFFKLIEYAKRPKTAAR